MSERTTAPRIPIAPHPAIEARVLVDLVRSFGFEITVNDEGHPFFVATVGKTDMDMGPVVERITTRSREDAAFKAAVQAMVAAYDVSTPANDAEWLCGEMENAGFNVCLMEHRNIPGCPPTLAFERALTRIDRENVLQIMDTVSQRFENEPQFADNLVHHLHSMGAAYKNV